MQASFSFPFLTANEMKQMMNSSEALRFQLEWYLASLSSVRISDSVGSAKDKEWYLNQCVSVEKLTIELSNMSLEETRRLLEVIPPTVKRLTFVVHGEFSWNAKYAPFMYDIKELSNPQEHLQMFLSLASEERFPFLETVRVKFHPLSKLTIGYRENDETKYETLDMRILRYSDLATLARKPSLEERFASFCSELHDQLPSMESVRIKECSERSVDSRAILTNYYNFVSGKIVDNQFAQLIFQEN
jgi:hypothetical protein